MRSRAYRMFRIRVSPVQCWFLLPLGQGLQITHYGLWWGYNDECCASPKLKLLNMYKEDTAVEAPACQRDYAFRGPRETDYLED